MRSMHICEKFIKLKVYKVRFVCSIKMAENRKSFQKVPNPEEGGFATLQDRELNNEQIREQ